VKLKCPTECRERREQMDFPATHKERRIENERVRMCVLVVDLGSERVSEVEC